MANSAWSVILQQGNPELPSLQLDLPGSQFKRAPVSFPSQGIGWIDLRNL
jgi:hypothetical protein